MRRVMPAAGCVLLTATVVLAFVVPAFTQGATKTTDPVSGKWGMDGVTYLELEYNSEGVVTGTTIWRHEGGYEERARITKGTFDSETGRLTLTGETKNRDGQLVKYAIDGRIEKDTLSGTYQVGTDTGEFTFKRQGK